MAATTLAILSVAISVYSALEVQKKQRAAKREAERLAEARKGFEVVTEGSGATVPLVYGRGKIGGIRVWCDTKETFFLQGGNHKNSISTFDTFFAAAVSEMTSFSHPGTANFRVNFSTAMKAFLGNAANVQIPNIYEVSTGGRWGNSNMVGVASGNVQITSIDENGFNITIKGDPVRTRFGSSVTYPDLTGRVYYYQVSCSKEVTNLPGTKNEYLAMQQVICQGPIGGIYDAVINDSQFIDDPELGDYRFVKGSSQWQTAHQRLLSATGVVTTSLELKKGIRIDCYPEGGAAHKNIVDNFPIRKDAVFTNLASISAIVKLDRDNPQFNDIPSISVFIEGKKVRTIELNNGVYSLSSTRVYKPNPALCLLDYLLDDTYGKALRVDQVDLESFYKGARVCDTIVQQNVYVGGKIWQPTNGSRKITRRDLPLYECNVVLDTTQTIRSNVSKLLSSMGNARLVWIAGKYRLQLQYPGVS